MSATSIGIEPRVRAITPAARLNGASLDGAAIAGRYARGNGNGKGILPSPDVATGRLDVLVPHLIRSQFLRPGFVRLSLWLGVARQMPSWAKLQFLNHGVAPKDLE